MAVGKDLNLWKLRKATIYCGSRINAKFGGEPSSRIADLGTRADIGRVNGMV